MTLPVSGSGFTTVSVNVWLFSQGNGTYVIDILDWVPPRSITLLLALG